MNTSVYINDLHKVGMKDIEQVEAKTRPSVKCFKTLASLEYRYPAASWLP